jgi:NAD(P)H-hydrate epimerase
MTAACADAGALDAALAGKAAVAIGPGLGRDDRARALVDAVLAAGVPAVLDADALYAIASRPDAVIGAAGPVVLTPHPGEAAALLGTSVPEIEADRLAAARALAARFRAVVVLKGARTIVCDGTLADDFCAINPTGGPALATGGTGDVLAGALAALVAQGLAPGDAARAGVWLHGAAGDHVGASLGRGATAREIADAIPHATLALVTETGL